MRTSVLIQAVLVAVVWMPLGECALADEARNVLVLYSNNRLVPGNVAVDRGLRSSLTALSGPPTQVYSEFLDRPDFGGEAYETTVSSYLRAKYVARPPRAIVAVSDEAFDFLVRHRGELFPGVPLVHAAVSPARLRALQPVPADVVGVPVEYDAAGTIRQALRWHPTARRLWVVTGASARDHEREAWLRREAPAAAGTVQVEFLAGLPIATLQQRLGALGADDVVFTMGFFQDGGGRLFNPRDATALITAAATAPVYGPLDTFIGIGVVGGSVASFEAMGQQAATIVNALLAGTTPSALRLAALTPTTLHVDWRQVQRWDIEESAIPDDAVVHFREPTFWEAYRSASILIAAVVLLQAALIATLLLERRRRRSAEVAVQKQRIELAHASRLAVAGELTASIAHEINQPLGAVQTSADAADLILQAGGDRRDDLLRIVTRIRRDNLRASDVIRRLRALLARHEPERQPFDLNAATSDVAAMLRAEAERRRVTLELRMAPAPAWVVGDQTQLQQVLINLILNALEAMSDLPDDRRIVSVAVEANANGIDLVVRDRGHGIANEHLPKLFDSFFSTKQRGMGLGLSIARTIVEAHGGRIWAETRREGGAAFHVELPRCTEATVLTANSPSEVAQ